MVLQQQYREKGIKKYSGLISLLLVAERNNDLLMRNHRNRSTRSTPLPGVDEVYSHYSKCGKGRGPVCGRGRSRGQGKQFLVLITPIPPKKNNHQNWKGKDEKSNANIYRTPRHLVELYQASLKNKGPEANLVYDNELDITHLDVTDFFEYPDGKIGHLSGDGSMVKDD
ncbi:uncharacterized protein LOC142174642 [Nicotiana tabacum]|uniref:Uncharacterized protein LOC142174642 n=1 Tax=Nicotiana tabacum TaxID=4097 RepID=A0AC58TH60_TOBAC